MYIAVCLYYVRRTLLRYIVCTACESNSMQLPINLFIIISMYQIKCSATVTVF